MRLKYIKLIEHPLFKSIEIDFIDNDFTERPFISLLIGKNGSGKSQILGVVSKIFLLLYDLKKIKKTAQKKADFDFVIKYSIDNSNFEISYTNTKWKFTLNGEDVKITNIELPTRTLASSVSLIDPFLFVKEDSNESYKYLGIKSASNNAFTNVYVTKSFKNIYRIIESNEESKLIELFETLDLSPEVKLIFEKGNLLKNEDILNWNFFELHFESFTIELPDEKKSFRKEKIKRIFNSSGSIKIAYEFIKNNKEQFINIENAFYSTHIDFCDKKNLQVFRSNIDALKILVDLEILKVSDFSLFRKEQDFNITNASSGETNLIFTFLNLMGEMKENSLVLIDEPEISLHPNWQLEYLELLLEIFSKYMSCHFLIATHSHFIVSDLQGDSSHILRMERNGTDYSIHPFLKDTYAWSAEEVLYRVFNLRTTRNFFFESDLTKLVNLISNRSSDTDLIKEYLLKLKKYKLSDEDPLNIVLENAEKYIAENATSN